MTKKITRGLFITGTNTGVGKTHIAAGIARNLVSRGVRVGVYKPAASGLVQQNGEWVPEDAWQLWQAAGCPQTLDEVCPQAFRMPVAPHLAARHEGRELDEALLRHGLHAWQDYEFVLVEGAGGLLSPLGDCYYCADLARDLNLPLLIVASNEIGVINQTLQTLMTARHFGPGLPVAGVVLNQTRPSDSHADPSLTSNAQELEVRCDAPLLATTQWNSLDSLAQVDWLGLLNTPSTVRSKS